MMKILVKQSDQESPKSFKIDKSDDQLMVAPDADISTGQAALLGLQHLLAMDVYVVPIIIAGMLSLPLANKMGLIQATFLAAGIGTILQTGVFMKMPVTQGASFVPLGALAGIYIAAGRGTVGMATIFGSLIVGALFVLILGFTHVVPKLIQKFVPSLVGGTIITNVGLSLIPSALNDNIFQASGNLNSNVLLGIITAGALVVCVMISLHFPQYDRIFRLGSILIALTIGTIVAAFMGRFSVKSVLEAPWFSTPKFALTSYGLHFSLSPILTMLIIYMVLMTETTGTWFAVSAVTNTKLTPQRINRGVFGEGVSCLVSALVGSTPVTGYSTNAGIISITGVASKKAFIGAGIWFILFSFVGKLSALLAAIPSAVIGGVFAIICSTIMLNGLRVVSQSHFVERALYILGIPIILTLGLVLMPSSLKNEAPTFVQYLLDSPIATAAITAIILNQLLPDNQQLKLTKVEK
ncbi:xanthine permease [Lentilactobacillus farraginis DSM 18382 = JCM 14108]|uniref:Xanthine permease n=2 Tax=Lentilactobacillus farraginis TaxID=390841 RepID=X0PGQ6_9LACO|nr:solute carrier family 23 protein [Lentilactobacillus farraginis]GAF35561.1 xanthine permease [Lentilactobacillus farraginis DSM 18382 = JCM 14108]